MKPLLVSQSDSAGGAARAALRLQQALVAHGIDSRMCVASKMVGDWRVRGPPSVAAKLGALLRPRLAYALSRLQHSTNPMPHSLACLPSSYAEAFRQTDSDIVNLHWVCGEMMSVADIGRIDRPVVWTMHDSWSFCGAENHPDGPDDRRYADGYDNSARRPGHRGLDLDAWVWRRKRKAWRRPFHLIAPSRWLADCARRSALMRDWPVRVIPNVLPTDVYRPLPRDLARQMFGLPAAGPIVLFGAVGGASKAKGWDLLERALGHLAQTLPEAIGVIVGQAEPELPPRPGLPLRFIGTLRDDVAMAVLYSAVDVVALPSRLENLPQMGTEAQACGVPVVGFDCSGLPDVVEHMATGYLARAYDPQDLARGIVQVLADRPRWMAMSARARQRALAVWSPQVVVPQYLAAYADACAVQGTVA